MISIPRNRPSTTNWHAVDQNLNVDVPIPNPFRCPISLDLMKDPVTLSTGITYDRDSIEKWIQEGNTKCPVTNMELTNTDHLIPNHTLRRMIQDWCVQNYRYGIQRIPTPRVLVTSVEVKEILSKFSRAIQRYDQFGCRNALDKIKSLCKGSDRNTKCFLNNGTTTMLSSGFHMLSSSSTPSDVVLLLSEILQVLIWMLPLNEEAVSFLGSSPSLNYLVWFLKSGDLSRRKNAVLVLKELLSSDQELVEAFAKIDEVDMLLFKLIKEPVCPTTTKASLIILSYLVSSEKMTSRLVGMGLISLLLEILVSSEKSICEKTLYVLDRICEHQEGREQALKHALTVPVIVKKVLRVSNPVNSFAVSILWKLCNNLNGEERLHAFVEVLQLGAFQKLLLLLQVGCDDQTKQKASKLLKMLNAYRDSAECIDSRDYNALNRQI